jgi:hypothetical protein
MDYSGKYVITRISRPRQGLIKFVVNWMVPFAILFTVGPVVALNYFLPSFFSSAGEFYPYFMSTVQSAIKTGLPMMLYGIGLLVAGIVSLNRYNRNLDMLRILSVDETMIIVGRQGEESRDCSYQVYWNELRSISAIHPENKFDPQHSWLILDTFGSKVFKIRWDNAFSWVDSSILLSRLKTYAPHLVDSMVESSLIPENRVTANSHTRLWLEYFSPPGKRNRTNKLVEGDVLAEGKYRVEGLVGSGGQGTAYLATRNDGVETLQVVLKEYILPVHKGEQGAAERVAILNRESEILARIDHQDIVKLIDCFVEDHRGYMVLEYVEGESLRDVVKREGPQDEETVLNWTAMICQIAQYLHGLEPPIIHRDITPDNLIMQKNGRIKLVDFTVAHQFDSSGGATIVGKQAYMPPEQFQGEPCPQSDLYAIGATMFFLLVGKDPSPMEASHPKLERESLSNEIDEIVSHATAFSVGERFADAEEHLRACRHLLVPQMTT